MTGDQVKACTKCGEVLPLDAFGLDPKGRLGRRSRCHTCHRAQSRAARKAAYAADPERYRAEARERRAPRVAANAERRRLEAEQRAAVIASRTEKACAGCGETKPLDAFHRNASLEDGLAHYCKPCMAAAQKRSRNRNPLTPAELRAKAEADRAHREANAERQRERAIAYRKANAHRERARARAWRIANRDRSNETKRRWIAANRDRRREISSRSAHLRRIRKAAGDVRLVTDKDLRRLYASPCIYCGSTGPVEADHVIPVSRGGRHSIGNLVPACRGCNARKHARLIVEWRYLEQLTNRRTNAA